VVPTELESERLLLRQFREEDWSDLHAYYSSVEATRYTVGRAFSEGETWRTMSAMIGHWQLRGFGPYAVQEKTSGTVLGTVGFWYPGDWPSPEIKWALAPTYWGRGFASEAARVVQATAHRYLPKLSLISLIHPDNAPSIQLALAVGASFDGNIEFRGGQWPVYRHPRRG
jgi:RimJ/RimL family protein N-acetyltransferase